MTDLGKLLCDKTILVVEDEALVAAYVIDLLADLGCESVISAHNVPSALEELRSRKPDLALLDLQLDGVITYRVAEVLAQHNVPVIFATGYGADVLEAEWAEYPCLAKPYSVDALSAAVVKAFGENKEAASA